MDPTSRRSRSLARRPSTFVAHWIASAPRPCRSSAVCAACLGPETTKHAPELNDFPSNKRTIHEKALREWRDLESLLCACFHRLEHKHWPFPHGPSTAIKRAMKNRLCCDFSGTVEEKLICCYFQNICRSQLANTACSWTSEVNIISTRIYISSLSPFV